VSLPEILDVTAGGRMMWYAKEDRLALYTDRRQLGRGSSPDRFNFQVAPDLLCDYRSLPFKDNIFRLVVIDPPHYSPAADSIMAIKYGSLQGDWRGAIAAGIKECYRVTRPGGTLVFKWSETKFKIGQLLELVDIEPTIGHRSGAKGNTLWVLFYKPKNEA